MQRLQTAPAWHAARRQRAGMSSWPFRTLTASPRRPSGSAPGDEGGWGAARAARWRLREARRALHVVGCLPVLCPAGVA